MTKYHPSNFHEVFPWLQSKWLVWNKKWYWYSTTLCQIIEKRGYWYSTIICRVIGFKMKHYPKKTPQIMSNINDFSCLAVHQRSVVSEMFKRAGSHFYSARLLHQSRSHYPSLSSILNLNDQRRRNDTKWTSHFLYMVKSVWISGLRILRTITLNIWGSIL